MLKLMSFVQLLTCGNLHTTFIVHANVKFVVPNTTYFGVCCKAIVELFFGVTHMWENIVCQKGEFMQWHKCECDKCNVNVLSLCPKEIEGFGDHVVAWR